MHNLQLTEDQVLILDTVRKYVQDAVATTVLHQDEHREHAAAAFDGVAELGLFGLPISDANGGAGMGLVPVVAALEEIAGQSGSLARLVLEQLKAAVALEGSASGSLAGLLTGAHKAVLLGPEHCVAATGSRLHGIAELVPGGGVADSFVVVAGATGSAAVYEVDAGSCERTPLRALGMASTSPCRVTIDVNGRTPTATGDAANKALARANLLGWTGGAAIAVGMGAASLSAAHKHASERIAFGKSLLHQQAVQRKLVDGRCAIDAARHIVYHAARLADLGEPAAAAAMAARIAAVEAAVLCADEAIQIHGGYGYTVEYHVERHYRDAKTLEVLDGGNQRLKELLAADWYPA